VLWHKYQHHSRILLLGTALDLAVMQITGQARARPIPLASDHVPLFVPLVLLVFDRSPVWRPPTCLAWCDTVVAV
jgi:hypothetical protein